VKLAHLQQGESLYLRALQIREHALAQDPAALARSPGHRRHHRDPGAALPG
jgi:hypothetical protein